MKAETVEKSVFICLYLSVLYSESPYKAAGLGAGTADWSCDVTLGWTMFRSWKCGDLEAEEFASLGCRA